MKIAFISDGAYAYASGAPDAVGGAERDQWLLARALVAAGWSATVGVRERLKSDERKTLDGVEYVGLSHRQLLVACHKFLLSERPDWLFWECAYHLWGPLVEIAKLTGVKTIFHAAFDSDVEPRKALIWRARWWPLYAWGLFRTDRILVQHQGQLARLKPQWRSKAYVLPKVCVLPNISEEKNNVKPHVERQDYIAWVGMLRKHKRPDVLLEIARKAPDIRFVVCGGTTDFGTRSDYLERIVNDLRLTPNIEYLGQVPPAKAQQIIGDAALLLSTSDGEGFPNVFVQAWSSGTPVVSLNIDPEDIIHKAGLGAVSRNVERAIEDITSLISSTQRRNDIAIRARKFVVDNYSASSVVSVFERALGGIQR